uniref:Uncharacterized protein n=1 Tax=Salix viminalis TaxID=40686 RepID=A0A6N2MQI2_SALVM
MQHPNPHVLALPNLLEKAYSLMKSFILRRKVDINIIIGPLVGRNMAHRQCQICLVNFVLERSKIVLGPYKLLGH